MKVLIFTLTHNRILYTKHCFSQLEKLAGYPYQHFIVENGSNDGTAEWLMARDQYDARFLPENKGITGGIKEVARHIIDFYPDIDLVIKFDNDCEVISADIIKRVVEFYEKNGPLWIVSPKIHGLNHPPQGCTTDQNGFNVELLPHIGGIFYAMPVAGFIEMAKMPLCRDVKMSEYFVRHGFRIGYLADLHANHYETTNGQVERYGDNWHGKYIF